MHFTCRRWERTALTMIWSCGRWIEVRTLCAMPYMACQRHPAPLAAAVLRVPRAHWLPNCSFASIWIDFECALSHAACPRAHIPGWFDSLGGRQIVLPCYLPIAPLCMHAHPKQRRASLVGTNPVMRALSPVAMAMDIPVRADGVDIVEFVTWESRRPSNTNLTPDT